MITLALSGICFWLSRKSKVSLYRKEGILVVVIIWFITPAIASLPFILSGTLSDPFQAYFEAASGFTTTGATTMYPKQYDPQTGLEVPITHVVKGVHDIVYTFYGTIAPIRDPNNGAILFEGIEAVGKAVLFWRSFTQWLGGMGIIVLFVAILPTLGVGGKMLFHAEMPGPIKDALTPRIKETASYLWKIYLVISIAEISFLMMTNSDITALDAFTITFSTVSTGGFSVKNTSIGNFDNATTEWIIVGFMFLSSINFSLYFFALKGKLYRLFDRELIIYIILLLFSCTLCSYFLVGTEKVLLTQEGASGIFNIEEAVRYGFFQVISAQTTTGFTTANYDVWPYASQVIMLIVMYFGGMAGSTAGGMKIIRLLLLFRIAQYKVESLFRPESVRSFHIGDSDVDTSAVIRTLCFFLIIVTISTLATFLYVMDGIDPETAIASVTCMINNIGISFRVGGPTESCAFMSSQSLSLSAFLMILGRLEFFVILAVLVPAFWKQRS